MEGSIQLIRSSRKTVAITVTREGKVIVRAPLHMPLAAIEAFVREKHAWIEKHQKLVMERRERADLVKPFCEEEIESMTARAKEIIPPRVCALARQMGVTYHRVTIKHQRTRWGSCSGKGNLNFNCLLTLCPSAVLDYVILHELCHLRHMDHSKAFWREVAAVCPSYENARLWLRKDGIRLMARLRAEKK